nr:hypothetical protein CFP56_24486 [Quercus suber]
MQGQVVKGTNEVIMSDTRGRGFPHAPKPPAVIMDNDNARERANHRPEATFSSTPRTSEASGLPWHHSTSPSSQAASQALPSRSRRMPTRVEPCRACCAETLALSWQNPGCHAAAAAAAAAAGPVRRGVDAKSRPRNPDFARPPLLQRPYLAPGGPQLPIAATAWILYSAERVTIAPIGRPIGDKQGSDDRTVGRLVECDWWESLGGYAVVLSPSAERPSSIDLQRSQLHLEHIFRRLHPLEDDAPHGPAGRRLQYVGEGASGPHPVEVQTHGQGAMAQRKADPRQGLRDSGFCPRQYDGTVTSCPQKAQSSATRPGSTRSTILELMSSYG